MSTLKERPEKTQESKEPDIASAHVPPEKIELFI